MRIPSIFYGEKSFYSDVNRDIDKQILSFVLPFLKFTCLVCSKSDVSDKVILSMILCGAFFLCFWGQISIHQDLFLFLSLSCDPFMVARILYVHSRNIKPVLSVTIH